VRLDHLLSKEQHTPVLDWECPWFGNNGFPLWVLDGLWNTLTLSRRSAVGYLRGHAAGSLVLWGVGCFLRVVV
jgi:hypothetical protein